MECRRQFRLLFTCRSKSRTILPAHVAENNIEPRKNLMGCASHLTSCCCRIDDLRAIEGEEEKVSSLWRNKAKSANNHGNNQRLFKRRYKSSAWKRSYDEPFKIERNRGSFAFRSIARASVCEHTVSQGSDVN